METLPTFNNPRTEAYIDGWPIGRQRCLAWFRVETNGKGERVERRTQNKTRTGWNKPKRTTYAQRFAIVDGDDGRTYLLGGSSHFNSIVVWLGDMQHTCAYVGSEDPRFYALSVLLADRVDNREAVQT